jgi:hypothetical protein
MPDWKKAAQAMGLDIPESQLDSITPSLDTLEKLYRPLPATLTPADDPAPLFIAFPDDKR